MFYPHPCFHLQSGEILAEADFYSGSKPQCSGKRNTLRNHLYSCDWTDFDYTAVTFLSMLCANSFIECQYCEQPAGTGPEGLQAGGQREGVVGLPQDPPAPSHHLCHPPVQPWRVKCSMRPIYWPHSAICWALGVKNTCLCVLIVCVLIQRGSASGGFWPRGGSPAGAGARGTRRQTALLCWGVWLPSGKFYSVVIHHRKQLICFI